MSDFFLKHITQSEYRKNPGELASSELTVIDHVLEPLDASVEVKKALKTKVLQEVNNLLDALVPPDVATCIDREALCHQILTRLAL
ncbi:MAG: hypothetical protein AB7F28_06530 [Candidatus Margulisiibacteriota bacterium]